MFATKKKSHWLKQDDSKIEKQNSWKGIKKKLLNDSHKKVFEKFLLQAVV